MITFPLQEQDQQFEVNKGRFWFTMGANLSRFSYSYAWRSTNI